MHVVLKSVAFCVGILFFPVFLLFLFLPCFVWRRLVIYFAGRFKKKELHIELSVDSCLTAVDDMYTRPFCSLCPVVFIEGDLPFASFKRRIQDVLRSSRFPELQCTLTRWFAVYFWKYCDTDQNPFVLENHIRIGQATNEDELETELEGLVTLPFTRNRPLWEIVYFPNFSATKNGLNIGTAYSLRTHHCLGDMFAFFTLLKGFEDPNTDVEDMVQALMNKFKGRLQNQRNRKLTLSMMIDLAIVSPMKTWWIMLSCLNANTWTLPKHRRRRTYNWCIQGRNSDIELETVKDYAKTKNVPLSVFMVSAFTTAIREAFLDAEESKSIRDCHVMYPLPKPHHPLRLTNHATAVPLRIPISVSNPAERLHLIHEEFTRWSNPHLALCSMSTANMVGIIQSVLGYTILEQHYGTALLSNVSFNMRIGTICGQRCVLSAGACGTQLKTNSVTFFSVGYNDKLWLGMSADKEILPTRQSVNQFLKRVANELIPKTD